MRKYIFVFAFFIFSSVFAQGNITSVKQIEDLKYFHTTQEIIVPDIALPTQVTIHLLEEQKHGIALLNKRTGTPQPWAQKEQRTEKNIQMSVETTSALIGSKYSFVDNNFETTAEFDLDTDNGDAFIELVSAEPITSSLLQWSLDANVALPQKISISAEINGRLKTILAPIRVSRSSISFPETTAKKWLIKFSHVQPLRLRNIHLVDAKSHNELTGIDITWLARPGETYVLYKNAATYVHLQTGESGNLSWKNNNMITAQLGTATPNTSFEEPDNDDDGVPDTRDNCVTLANPEQTDLDKNEKGDACEDRDGDRIVDSLDNCPEHPNRQQKDADGDNIGDVCDKEESRLTENIPWLPWMGMGLASLVIVFIVWRTLKGKDKKS